MPSRRKYRETVLDTDQFVRDATMFFGVLRSTKTGLRYNSEHYQILHALGESVADAIRQISGEEVPWMQAKYWPRVPAYNPKDDPSDAA